MNRWMFVAAGWGVAVAAVGAWLTDLSPWYFAMRFPSWKPPDWLFGPAWTVILACASYAAYLGWTRAEDVTTQVTVAGLFVVNGLLNMMWSLLFFRFRRPDLALAEVGLLWLSIAALIFVLSPVSRIASLLMVPYITWVTYASVLNRAIVRLNAPFAGLSGPNLNG
jgi:benzodiazapine receptor